MIRACSIQLSVSYHLAILSASVARKLACLSGIVILCAQEDDGYMHSSKVFERIDPQHWSAFLKVSSVFMKNG
jgi:hypothetical protein